MTTRRRRGLSLLTGLALLAAGCSTAAGSVRFASPTVTSTSTTAPLDGAVTPVRPAEPSRWRPLGEPGAGGHITGLAIDPSDPARVLVGGDLIGAGLSTDGGATWQPTFGLTNGELSRFTFHPTRRGEVWVATMGGPFVSTDGGTTWQPRRVGMPALRDIGYSAPVDEVLVDPGNPDRLLAFGGSHRGWDAPGTTGWGVVWESSDAGGRWSALATVAGGANLVDATWLADGTLLVAALGNGVQRSIDGGRTWSAASTGLPHGSVRALAAHPTDAGTVWAALGAVDGQRGVEPGGVWQSRDGGRSWQASGRGLDLAPGAGSGVRFAPHYPVIAVSAADPDVLLTANVAYGTQAVFRSSDGGANWVPVVGARTVNRPATAYSTPISAEALALDPTDARRAFIGNAEFVLVTTDGGKRWTDATSDTLKDGTTTGRGYSGLVATRIAFAPDGRELLLCGMDGANPLLRRAGAAGWSRPLVASDPWGGCVDAAYSVAHPGRRYVLLGQGDIFGGVAVLEPDNTFRIVAGGGAGLPERRSTGPTPGAVEVVGDPAGGEAVLVAAGGVLYRSTDGATTFRVVDRSLGATELAADPGRPGRVLIAGAAGVAASDDGGERQTIIVGSPAGVNRLAVDPAAGRLYATVWRGAGAGLWRSDGATFTRLLGDPTTYDVAVDPADPDHLLVATNDHPFHDVIASPGVMQSTDGGVTWAPANRGLPLLRVAAVAFDPDRRGRVVIGTFGRGYFEATDLR